MPNTPADSGWTLRTILAAFAIALAVLVAAALLRRAGLWPAVPWSEIAAGALSGAIYLAVRHPASRVLAFVVFLPVCLFALVILGYAVLTPIWQLLE